MLKDLKNSIPTSMGLNSGRDSHLCQAWLSCSPWGSALGSWPDTHSDTRPRSPLLVGIVYLPEQSMICGLGRKCIGACGETESWE